MREQTTGMRGHTPGWYERLARQQEGYYYPWESTTAEGGGEAAYAELVRQHLTPERDVLEPGCGHGVDAVAFAPLCRTLRAYDQVDRFITLARQAVADGAIDNTTFLCRSSSADRNGGRVTVPALTASIDVVISRRGPTNWIEDAPRFCRPGAVLIQLNPLGQLDEYAWNRQLPEDLRLHPPDADPDNGMRERIETRLATVGLAIHSCWTYDVPEWLRGPRELYRFLTFGQFANEIPSWPEVEPELSDVFERHAGELGLELRNRCFLWKAVFEPETSPSMQKL